MKIAIGIFLVFGIAMLITGKITGKSENADTAFSAIIPYMIGAGSLAISAGLTIIFGLYRLFTS